jgi:dihydrofolate reductase
MRKIIVSVNVTLDGYMAGPNCELDWHFNSWNDEMAESITEQLSKADTILLGRVTYKGMAQHFTSAPVSLLTPREDLGFAEMLNHYPKIVFSKTLTTVVWNNSKIVKGNMAREVIKLKQQAGKDMIIYGSGQLVASLTKLGLIDEYRIWVHPVVLGDGKPLFKEVQQKLNLSLYKTQAFSSGVVILYYEVKKA